MVKAPRSTTYNGIKMRSRTEAAVARYLDSRKCEWEYEPGCFANENGQYLPDFKVTRNSQGACVPSVYMEVKPKYILTEPNAGEVLQALMERMEIILSSDPADLELVFWDYDKEKVILAIVKRHGSAGWKAKEYGAGAEINALRGGGLNV